MDRPASHRLLSLVLLALWSAPGAMALILGLHVALDHHAGISEEFELSLADLALAAVHGHHHHTELAAGHEHEAIVDSAAPVVRPDSSCAATFLATAQGASLTGRTKPERDLRRGPPPQPIFTANCSLLL